MNKEEPYRNQAERLKQRIEKINEKTTDVREQLPPREQIHREKRKKTKWKLKYPVIRLLVLSFILLPIIIFSIYSYLDGGKSAGIENVSGNSSGYETINLEKSKTNTDSSPLNEDEDENEVIETNQENADGNGADIDKGDEAVEVQPSVTPEDTVIPSTNVGSNVQGTDKNSGVTSKPATSQPAEIVAKSTIIYHTVQPKENLFRIAMKYYHSKAGEDIIKKANNLQDDQIYVGQVLKIPLDK